MGRPKKLVGGCSNDTSERTENEKWTYHMDDILLDALIQEDEVGNMVGGTFTSTAYENVLKELSAKLNKDFTKQQIKNRLKTIKKKFNEYYDIFKGGMSRFSWSPLTKMWGAEPEVWKALIEVKPLAQKWMNTSIPNYERLSKLFGTDRATGSFAETAKEKTSRWAREKEQILDGVCGDEDLNKVGENVLIEEQNCDEISQAPTRPTTSSSSKKRKSEHNLEETVKLLAMSMQQSNDILKETLMERNQIMRMSLEKNQQPRVYREEEVYEELKRLGVDMKTRMRAYKFLNENAGRVRAFFGCPSEDRLEFLKFEMQSVGDGAFD